MNRRTVSENRLGSARTVTSVTAAAVRSEIDGVIADFESALEAASRIESASDQYIAVAFEYGLAVAEFERLKSDNTTKPNDLKDAEEKMLATNKRLDQLKVAFNAAEATLNRAHADIDTSFAAAGAALVRFRESAQVSSRLVHKMVGVASSTKS